MIRQGQCTCGDARGRIDIESIDLLVLKDIESIDLLVLKGHQRLAKTSVIRLFDQTRDDLTSTGLSFPRTTGVHHQIITYQRNVACALEYHCISIEISSHICLASSNISNGIEVISAKQTQESTPSCVGISVEDF